MNNQDNDLLVNCAHFYQLKETKKQRAERPSYGFSSAKNWKRIDIYYCVNCLAQKIIVQEADWLLSEPEWW